MPKTKISEYSATANSNTDVASVNIDEGCAPSGINNAIRAVMGHLKDFQAGTSGDAFNGATNGAHNGSVGATTPAAGTFTTLSATGNVTLGDAASDTVTVNGTTNFTVAPTIGGVGINGFKNRIINGAMVIDQRNAGASVNASGSPRSTFVVDRFWVASGGGTNTAQRVAGVNGFQYGIKITGASGVTQTQFGQAIESNNTADLVNQNVTLSFSAQASANYTQKFYIVYPNSTDNYGGYTTIASPTFSITTSAQSFSYTFNAGANAANGIMVFASDTGFTTGFNATFSGMQLEKGSTATSFDYRPYGTELALCQRYFCSSFPIGIAPQNNIPQSEYQVALIASGDPQIIVQFPVQMRTDATVTLYNPNRTSPAGQWDRGAGYSGANARCFSSTSMRALIDNTDVALTSGAIGISWSATAEL